jgi:hypothetical protein
MSHVAMVIMNRVNNPRWWGHDIESVCKAPYQFSCWLESDPNLAKMKEVTTADPQFRAALSIAGQAIAGKLDDATENADSYYALSMREPPIWAAKAAKTLADGFHQFCRTELPAKVEHCDVSPVSVNATVAAGEEKTG